MHRCPRCRDPLTFRGEGDAFVELCAGCGGILLEPWRAQRLFDSLAPGATLSLTACDGQHGLNCPDCARPMHWRVTSDGSAQFLECRPHGLWFDCFELARLARAPTQDRTLLESPDNAASSAVAAATRIATLVLQRTVESQVPRHARCDGRDTTDTVDGRALGSEGVEAALDFVASLVPEFVG